MRNIQLLTSALVGILVSWSPARAECDPDMSDRTLTARYQINAGEVLDTNTNLTWARCSVGQSWNDATGCTGKVRTMNFDEAQKSARGVWRVPTKNELKTLISTTCRNPSINKEVFPKMNPDTMFYWSSTADDASVGWFVDFDTGNIYGHRRSDALAVRLVRSAQ